MTTFGYARVSTNDQDLSSQRETLSAAGCTQIFEEKVSGIKSDRKELGLLLKCVQNGDTVIVTRLDRLARSQRDLLNILDILSKKGAAFKSLSDPWCDTTTPHGRLMLAVLGGLAEFERDLIKARTSEGRRRAAAAGVRFGNPGKLSQEQRHDARQRLSEGDTVVSIAGSLGVNPRTISRLRNEKAVPV